MNQIMSNATKPAPQVAEKCHLCEKSDAAIVRLKRLNRLLILAFSFSILVTVISILGIGFALMKREGQASVATDPRKQRGISNQSAVPSKPENNAPEYSDQIKIINLKAAWGQSWGQEKGAAMDIKVKNIGNRTVTDLRVTVFFQDANGETIHEHDFTMASSHEIIGASIYNFNFSPIKPNYVREIRGTMDTTVPPDWKQWAVTAKVSSISVE
jgi:hypothetical protein